MAAQRIYLTGFMGSGKSTAGAILANVLGYAFEDLDDTIAEKAGQSVQAIFATEGEETFRAREREALYATKGRKKLVVAVGGGALAQPDNMTWALAHGTVVYLALTLDALVERLQHLSVPRPLLLGPDGKRLDAQALRARTETLLQAREGTYRRAHLTLPVDSLSLGPMVDALAAAVRHHATAGQHGG